MQIVERGSGEPLVLIPGIQGRWEYTARAVDALAAFFRVVTFSLAGEPSSQRRFDPELGLGNYVRQVRDAMDMLGIPRAVVSGVSFGGLAALRFAAEEPSRTSHLILVSTPGPSWHLKRRHEMYARLPWLFGPVFLAETPARLRAEVARALPNPRARRSFARHQLKTLITSPVSPARMARRARLMGGGGAAADCARISAPTLIVTGDRLLDHVVPVEGTSEYARLIANARAITLCDTGHLGCVTRPDDFAQAVRTFVSGTSAHASADTAMPAAGGTTLDPAAERSTSDAA